MNNLLLQQPLLSCTIVFSYWEHISDSPFIIALDKFPPAYYYLIINNRLVSGRRCGPVW